MTITVFGASGKVGRLVVRSLLNNGDNVIAFIHNSSPFEATKQLRLVKGDIHNLRDVKMAIKGSDAVISTLGSWGTPQKDIVSSGMNNIIPAMKYHGLKRIVSLTGSDALAGSDKPNLVSRTLHLLIRFSPAHAILADGELQIQLLEKSALNWTVLRSPIMNNHGDSAWTITADKKPNFWVTIDRQSVAKALVKLINKPDFYKQAPFIVRQKDSH